MRRAFDRIVFSGLAWATLAGAAFAEEAGHDAEGGIPFDKLGFHLFNLVILLAVLTWALTHKVKLSEILKHRSARVKYEIDDVNALRKEAQARFDELEQRLEGFEQRLAAMRREAEADAEAERKLILERADRDAADVARAAERTIRDETARARQALLRDAAKLAVDLAARQVRDRFRPADQERLVADFFSAVYAEDAPVELPEESELPNGR